MELCPNSIGSSELPQAGGGLPGVDPRLQHGEHCLALPQGGGDQLLLCACPRHTWAAPHQDCICAVRPAAAETHVQQP